jgi:hypothetical protein
VTELGPQPRANRATDWATCQALMTNQGICRMSVCPLEWPQKLGRPSFTRTVVSLIAQARCSAQTH